MHLFFSTKLKFPWVVTVFTKEPANHPTNPTTHQSLQHQGINEFLLSNIITLITDVTSRIRAVSSLLFRWIPQNNNLYYNTPICHTDSAFCRPPPFLSRFLPTLVCISVSTFFLTSQNLKNITKKFLFCIVCGYLQKSRLLMWRPWKCAATDTFLLCWCLQPALQTWQNTTIMYSMQTISCKFSNVREKRWICPSTTFTPPLNFKYKGFRSLAVVQSPILCNMYSPPTFEILL